MSKTKINSIIKIQILYTFITTFCIYMFFALLDNDFGFDGILGLMFFQPIIAFLLSGLTILICLIIGLPIRLYSKLNSWWTKNFYISIIGVIIGLMMILLALLPAFNETVTYNLNEQPTSKQIPNLTLSCIGWLLTAFSILHSYTPPLLIKKIKNIIITR